MKSILVLWGEEIKDFEETEEVFLMKIAVEKIKKENLKKGSFLIYNRIEDCAKEFIFENKKVLNIMRVV